MLPPLLIFSYSLFVRLLSQYVKELRNNRQPKLTAINCDVYGFEPLNRLIDTSNIKELIGGG